MTVGYPIMINGITYGGIFLCSPVPEIQQTIEGMLEVLLSGMDLEITDTLPVEFACNCSKDRVRKALISIGREELQSMIDDGETIEVNCHFCNKNYNFTVDELKQMIQ